MDSRRKITRILFAVTIIIVLSISNFAAAVEPEPSRIVVYYFHGNFRCVNCRNIEQYTKETVEKYFQKELDSGAIVFEVVNVETKGNQHFTNDYQLYTKSVVLSLIKDNKEVKFDNLTKVWEHLKDRDAFYRYIKTEVEKYLKEL